jgi:hypothetical protein
VQRRLDEVLGVGMWEAHYSQGPSGIVFCKLRVCIVMATENSPVELKWIEKMDGAGASDIEADKGAVSGALKRAASAGYGIGRYLYDIESPWVAIEKRGKSYVIQKSEKLKLLAVLGGEAPERPEQPPSATVEADWGLYCERMVTWLDARDVSRLMVMEYLGLEDGTEWGALTPEHLLTITEQTKLVASGELSPVEAFSKSAQQAADSLTEKISGAGPAPLDPDRNKPKPDEEF